MSAIAKNIAAARKRAGLTPDDLAARTGAARSSVCEWERGDHEPRLPMLRKIAKVLRIDLGTLLGG